MDFPIQIQCITNSTNFSNENYDKLMTCILYVIIFYKNKQLPSTLTSCCKNTIRDALSSARAVKSN